MSWQKHSEVHMKKIRSLVYVWPTNIDQRDIVPFDTIYTI